MVHGLAGSAALMLLVLATIRGPLQGLCYILVFGAGSTLGMLAISALLSLPFIFTVDRAARAHRSIRLLAGSASIAYGGWILLHAEMLEGLFRF